MVVIQDGPHWLEFEEPVRVVCVNEPGEVLAALHEVETAVSTENLYAAGFLTYEASAAFGLAVHSTPEDGLPLLWFGLYKRPRPPRFQKPRRSRRWRVASGVWLGLETCHSEIGPIFKIGPIWMDT